MMKQCLILLLALGISFASSAEPNMIYEQRAFSFPGGLTKALVLSYDDGLVQDARFIELLSACGIKGTFHINSGRLGMQAAWMTELIGDPGWYVKAEDLADVYREHEVASHTVNHPHLLELDDAQIRDEIVRDVETLESLVAADVESFAYPFGEFDDRLVAVLEGTGITNARTAESTGSFSLPGDFLRWHPTAHHTQALALVDDFLSIDGDEPLLFMIWGHSWEFDGDTQDNHWGIAEQVCERLSGLDDTWYVGAAEFVRYVEAVKGLQHIDGEWVNRSGQPVWVRSGNQIEVIAPQ